MALVQPALKEVCGFISSC